MKRHWQFPLPLLDEQYSERLRVPNMLAPRKGQGLVEFALAVPFFLLLVCTLIGFGIMLENKTALNNAARNGARFAATQPWLYDGNDPAAANSIEGAVQHSGSTVNIANDSHIQISFWQPSSTSSTSTQCGSYKNTSHTISFVGSTVGSTTYTANTCIIRGNIVQVSVSAPFALPVPLISRFFPSGVTIATSATAMVEQNCSSAVSPNCS